MLNNSFFLQVGLIIGRFAYDAITRSPKSVLVPVVAFMTVIGSFSIRNSLSDVGMMIILGIIGFLAGRRGFSASHSATVPQRPKTAKTTTKSHD